MTKIRIGTVNGNVVIGDLSVDHTALGHEPVDVVRNMSGSREHISRRRERRATVRPPTEIDQRDLQQMIDRLSDRTPVVDFMEREYGTRTIFELESNQLYHLRWYVEVLLHRG